MNAASQLLGPNPKGSLRKISLAVRMCLRPWAQKWTDGVVLFACSGGADSLAMTVCGLDLTKRLGLKSAVIYIDHGIRSDSAAEGLAVTQLCQKLGADHVEVHSVTLAEQGGPEAAARQARYRGLQECATGQSANGTRQVIVLLGHTLDDQAETVMLGLGRGSGTVSLSGMSAGGAWEKGLDFARPLLKLRRTDTLAACKTLGLTPVSDPTNKSDGPWRCADGSALHRAAVREGALPALTRALGQDPAPALARTAELLSRDQEALNSWAKTVKEQILYPYDDISRTNSRTICFRLPALVELPQAIRTRVFVLVAADLGSKNLQFSHLEQIDNLVTNYRGQGPVFLPQRLTVSRRGQDLIFAVASLRLPPK